MLVGSVRFLEKGYQEIEDHITVSLGTEGKNIKVTEASPHTGVLLNQKKAGFFFLRNMAKMAQKMRGTEITAHPKLLSYSSHSFQLGWCKNISGWAVPGDRKMTLQSNVLKEIKNISQWESRRFKGLLALLRLGGKESHE